MAVSRQAADLAPSSIVISSSESIHQTAPTHTQQLRFHRTDYEGPGKYDERETGSQFGSHDHSHGHHSHSHDHETTSNDTDKLRRLLEARYTRRSGSYEHRGYTVGIGGPVGSGKTALTLALCKALRGRVPMGVVTNDIFTQEDAEFLVRNEALDKGRIMPVETGGCPHAAIREDVSANLGALEVLTRRIKSEEGEQSPLLLCESGGDNLAANFSNELADYTIYVIDVAGGDKVPRKGGPGITQSDLLVINKIDLAEAVGASLEVLDRDASKMRKKGHGGAQNSDDESGPTIFASVKNGTGMDDIISHILKSFDDAHELAKSVK